MGISATPVTASCGTSATSIATSAACTATFSIPYQGVSLTSAFVTSASVSLTVTIPTGAGPQSTTQQFGTPITAGAIVLSSGAQIQFVLCGSASGSSGNTLSPSIVSGSTYSLKVVATDGSTSVVSVKAK
jgi:hypothetical protein